MATHSRAAIHQRGIHLARGGFVVTLCAIAVVLALAAPEEGGGDVWLLVIATALAAVGYVVRRICATRSRTADRGAYARRFGTGADRTPDAALMPLGDRERATSGR